MSINPALWFRSEAEDAANFYVSIFPNSKILNAMRAGGHTVAVDFTIDGMHVTAINGRAEVGFNDSHSFVVPCDSQAEIDRYWNALTDGGDEGQCGWLKDRFGVSWQVVPKDIGALLAGPDAAKNGRAMQAMLGMRKLDVAALRSA